MLNVTRVIVGSTLLITSILCDAAKAESPKQTTISSAATNPKTPPDRRTSVIEQHGTKEDPLFLEGEITTRKSKEDAEADHSVHRESAALEWWLAAGTVGLAGITLLLCLITGVLAYYTFRLWRESKETSSRQADEMKTSLKIAKESADAARAAVELSRDEFIATHRPRIIVRKIWPDKTKYHRAEFTMANIGSTKANNIRINAELLLIGGPGEHPTPLSIPDHQGNKSLAAGDSSMESAAVGQDLVEEWSMADGFGSGVSKIYFRGLIAYEDDLGRRYQTAFCRMYNPSLKRFEQASAFGEDEYQD